MSEKFFKCAGCGMPDYGPMYRLGLCHECWITRAYAGEFDDELPDSMAVVRTVPTPNPGNVRNTPEVRQWDENEWVTYVEKSDDDPPAAEKCPICHSIKDALLSCPICDADEIAPTQLSRSEPPSNASSAVNGPERPQHGENEWVTYVE